MSKFSRNGGIIGNQVDTSAGASGVWGDYDAFSLKKNSQWGTIAVPPGSATYTTAGTYSWPAPPIVTSVCVVCIGGGGGGHQAPSNSGGGGGGGLAFGNDIPVVGGQSYTVVVGSGGNRSSPPPAAASNATDGGDSYFINSSTLCGKGGQAGKYATSAPAGAGGFIFGNGVQVVELVEMVLQQHHLLVEKAVVAAVLAVMVVMADQVVVLDPDPCYSPYIWWWRRRGPWRAWRLCWWRRWNGLLGSGPKVVVVDYPLQIMEILVVMDMGHQEAVNLW